MKPPTGSRTSPGEEHPASSRPGKSLKTPSRSDLLESKEVRQAAMRRRRSPFRATSQNCCKTRRSTLLGALQTRAIQRRGATAKLPGYTTRSTANSSLEDLALSAAARPPKHTTFALRDHARMAARSATSTQSRSAASIIASCIDMGDETSR
jgi:hypothetical protein